MTDVNPCEALRCAMIGEPIETCRDHRCPHRWQRAGREDRTAREAKDAARPCSKQCLGECPGHAEEKDNHGSTAVQPRLNCGCDRSVATAGGAG